VKRLILFLFLQAAWLADKLQVNGSVIGALAEGRREQRGSLALRYFTWKKMFNVIRVEAQLRLGRRKVRGAPFEWEIDTTNICQLKCPLCHTGLGTVHRDKGIMHYDVFTKTIDQIKDYCVWLTLYSWGEPFLNRRIHEFVAYAHQNNIATIISTNLNKPLTPEMAENIIKSGLDVMIISLDGVTQEVYEIYRVGGRLERVLNNIKLLAQKKRELGQTAPHLEWQFIVMRQNEHQMEDARRLAAELGVDSIVFKKVDFPHGEDDPKVAERWLPREHPGYLRGDPFYKPYHEDGQRCWRLWRSAVVNWDGGLAPCCYLTDKSDDFGNVNTSTVADIWNNSDYLTARGLFEDGYEPQQWVGCMSCSVYLSSRAARKRGPLDLQPQPVYFMPRGGLGPHGATDGSGPPLSQPASVGSEQAEGSVKQ
jgi:MoaA/NifB/PqqE/SkfB family radical SAM enzyme